MSKEDDINGAWAELFVAHAVSIRHIEEKMAGRAPLTLDEYDVLLNISRQPKHRIRLSKLADASVYTKSGITRIVRRLEVNGFLQHHRCEDDKRGTYAVLTENGKKAMKETWRWYGAGVAEVLGDLFTSSELRALQGLLGRIVEKFSREGLVQLGGS